MYLSHLQILNYKNYRSAAFYFDRKFTLITGENGAGKTNLIDAVHYLCLCKSYFTRQDALICNHGTQFFRLDGEFISGGEKTHITGKYQQTQTEIKKEFLRNGVAYDRLSDHIGLFPVVMITPHDIEIIRDGSEGRRRFLDTAISQVDYEYLRRLMRYNKILQQRNSLLKNTFGTKDDALLEALNRQLAPEGDAIFEARRNFLSEFTSVFSDMYKKISGDKEEPGLQYVSQLHDHVYIDLLKNSVRDDLDAGRTTKGIHRDDLQFTIDGFSLKETGSQGQVKSFLIAIKLAQHKMILGKTGKKSILLLDDIFEKLDQKRLSILFSLLTSADYEQVFITDADTFRSMRFMEENSLLFSHVNISDGKIQ